MAAETRVALRPPRPIPGGIEKAAILLLTLGSDAAASVFRHLSEPEVRQISGAIARLRTIPSEAAAAVHEEAWRRLAGHDGLLVDGERFARQLVATALAGGTEERDDDDLERVTRQGGELLASSLEPVPPAALAELLAREHPQTVALVVANLPARKAGEVLGQLPETLQADIVQRIADLQRVPADVLADLGDVLHGQVRGLRAPEGGPAGARIAAQIMNAAPPTVGERVFAHLDEHAPELGEAIRALMLTFEDLVRLDNRGMQTLLKEVPREDLLLALKTASPAMRDKIFGNLSQRAAEILKDDMATMGPVRVKDVEKAQAGIVAVARRLESEQRITLGGGGDDVVL
jgi:flagellar motor switch protein FliG